MHERIQGADSLAAPVWKVEELRRLVRKDPELLDLSLGVLFHYDP
ncbi:MAG: hypothetical protein OXF33_03215 [Rhodospirillales bacterium]|nr:hypothetical protein [Rhodospirillales bacterium]